MKNGVNEVKLIAIDLDGTLVDSVIDIAYSVDGMLEQLGRPLCGIEKVKKYLGNGVERLVKRALTDDMQAEPSSLLYEKALAHLLVLYGENNGDRAEIYPGVLEALTAFQAAEIQLCCVTNKKREFTEPLLASLGLSQYFSLLVCGDDLPRKKPDPLPLQHAMQHYGLTPVQSVMIGDSSNDIRAAHAAGMQVAAVTYGYNHGEDIRQANADWVIDSMTEVCTILRQAA